MVLLAGDTHGTPRAWCEHAMSKWEIERKLLWDREPPTLETSTACQIRQGYLAVCDNDEVRVRSADHVCTLTVTSGRGLARSEHEVHISEEQFEALWPTTAGGRLEKKRCEVLHDGRTLYRDTYQGELRGLRVVEIEFASTSDAESFVPPEWFGREVTGAERYSNASLAATGLTRLAGEAQ